MAAEKSFSQAAAASVRDDGDAFFLGYDASSIGDVRGSEAVVPTVVVVVAVIAVSAVELSVRRRSISTFISKRPVEVAAAW